VGEEALVLGVPPGVDHLILRVALHERSSLEREEVRERYLDVVAKVSTLRLQVDFVVHPKDRELTWLT
jgi:hypothetical protein